MHKIYTSPELLEETRLLGFISKWDTVTGMFLFAFVLLSKVNISQIQVRWSGLTRNVYFYASCLKLLDDPGGVVSWKASIFGHI